MSATAFENLAIAEERLQLTRTIDNQFFPEWQGALPELELEVTEQASLDQVHQRYLYQRSLGQLLVQCQALYCRLG